MDTKNLYVKRNLINSDNIYAWATEQGFFSLLNGKDMHVTIAYSNEKIDWSDITPKKNKLKINGGKRSIKKLGKAIVLCFDSELLHERWQEFKDEGANWDFPEYITHISLSYSEQPDLDLEKIIPYMGELLFGNEIFDEINDNFKEETKEIEL